MPEVNLSLFIDKDVYSKRNGVVGYKSDFITPRYTFNKGAYIGKVYSYQLDQKSRFWYLLIYVTQYDYDNFIPTYFRIKSNDLDVKGLAAAIKAQEDKEKQQASNQQRDEMGTIPYYIEKYAPTVIFGFLGIKLITSIITKR